MITFVDEALAIGIFIYYMFNKHIPLKEFKWFCFIVVGYILYSLLLGIAGANAIFMDVIIQIKPFLVFYCAISLGLQLSQEGKKRVRWLVLLLLFITLILTIVNYNFTMCGLFGHPSRYGTFCTLAGFVYYYCSDRSDKSLKVTIIIWACMLACLKIKSVGFFVLAFLLTAYFSDIRKKIKFNVKTVLWLIAGFVAMMYFAWERFEQFYIENGIGAGSIEEMYARPALYAVSVEVIRDYFPLGSGFGTFASWASGVYYSPLYFEYDLDGIIGLRPDEYSFVSDTYFPVLAQFGILGVCLFVAFMWRRAKINWVLYKRGNSKIVMLMISLILLFFIIESTSDSTLIQNRGVVMMLVLALYYNESRVNITSRASVERQLGMQ